MDRIGEFLSCEIGRAGGSHARERSRPQRVLEDGGGAGRRTGCRAEAERGRQIPYTGLSADYVYRETKRAVEGAAGTKTLIWPGIDIDIPTGASHSKSTPQGTKAAVTAAFQAGAHGVLLSRKYSEMRVANLSGAGEAIRELGPG